MIPEKKLKQRWISEATEVKTNKNILKGKVVIISIDKHESSWQIKAIV
jgi:murein L,D-transpeptidase YafK